MFSPMQFCRRTTEVAKQSVVPATQAVPVKMSSSIVRKPSSSRSIAGGHLAKVFADKLD
ncbi:hypothetical protein KSF73_12780 [Burkholderiaceae bacterium DAT-1]|nr:hypothetical protein [Burkholderiaceae bacterium DAT-1]